LCVLTRMVGAARLRGRAIALIPIGGKSVGAAGQAFHHDLSGFVAALAKAMRGERTNDHALKHLHQVATRLLQSAHLNLALGNCAEHRPEKPFLQTIRVQIAIIFTVHSIISCHVRRSVVATSKTWM
jgi:hypothetical protein